MPSSALGRSDLAVRDITRRFARWTVLSILHDDHVGSAGSPARNRAPAEMGATASLRVGLRHRWIWSRSSWFPTMRDRARPDDTGRGAQVLKPYLGCGFRVFARASCPVANST